MKVLAAVLSLMLASCSIPLTPEGASILVVKKFADLPTECVKLETYSAQSRFGTTKALNSIRNKVGSSGKGDTLLISSLEHGKASPSSRISVIAFDCKKYWAKKASNTQPDQTQIDDQLDKQKLCQSKSGTWINNQCVLNLD